MPLWLLFFIFYFLFILLREPVGGGGHVGARFVTTARFVTKVTKRAAMPARFFTNEVVTTRAGIAPFFSLGYQYM